MTLLQKVLPVLLVITLSGTGCGPQGPGADLVIGQTFPILDLTGLEGEQVSTAEFRGRAVLLNVWAPWCPPCVEEMPALQQLSLNLDPDHYLVIGLTVDDRFLAQEFLRHNGITFGNYFDPDREVVTGRLKVEIFPQTFLIDAQGRLVYRWQGWRPWPVAKTQAELEALLPPDTRDGVTALARGSTEWY